MLVWNILNPRKYKKVGILIMNGPFFHFSGTFHSPFLPGGNRGRRTSSRLLPPRCRAQRRFPAIAGGITGQVGRWRFSGVQTEANGFFMVEYGYGSIPINTIFRGMNIHKSQLFWCELQGYKVLTHCHITDSFSGFGFSLSWFVWKWSIINYPQIYSRAIDNWKKSDQTLKWSLNEISWKSAEGENMEDDTNEIGKYGQLWRTIENQHNICVVMWWLLYSELFIGCAQVWLTSHLQAHNGSTWYSEHTLCHKVSSGRNSTENQLKLVGGFKHVLFSIIYGIVLSIDFHIFQRS